MVGGIVPLCRAYSQMTNVLRPSAPAWLKKVIFK